MLDTYRIRIGVSYHIGVHIVSYRITSYRIGVQTDRETPTDQHFISLLDGSRTKNRPIERVHSTQVPEIKVVQKHSRYNRWYMLHLYNFTKGPECSFEGTPRLYFCTISEPFCFSNVQNLSGCFKVRDCVQQIAFVAPSGSHHCLQSKHSIKTLQMHPPLLCEWLSIYM